MQQHVNLSRGFRRFLFYLLVSAALGLFVRSTAQKWLLEYWVELLPEAQKHGIAASVPELTLSRSGFPVVGAQIQKIESQKPFRFQNHCFQAKIQANDVFLPLNFVQIILQKIELGTLQVGQLHVSLQEEHVCADSPSLAGVTGEDIKNESQSSELSSSLEMSHFPRWFILAEKWFADQKKLREKLPIKAINTRQLLIEAQYLNGKTFRADGESSISMDDILKGDMRFFQIELRKGQQKLSSQMKLSVLGDDKSFLVKSELGFDEGRVVAALDVDHAGLAKVSLSSHQLPMSVVNKWLETPWSFQYLWFNCQLSLQSNKNEWIKTSWLMDQCHIDGPHGKVTLKNKTIESLRKPTNLIIAVEELNMNKVIKSSHELPLTGVFKGLGFWNADIEIIDQDNWLSKYSIKSAEIVFSRNNRRKLQSVELIEGDAGAVGGLSKYFIRSVKLDQGQYKGVLAFEYDSKTRSKRGTAFVEKLSFAPEIQQLMFDGQISSINLSSSFFADRDGLKDLSASLRVGKYTAMGVEAREGVLRAELSADKKIQFKVQAESAKLSSLGHQLDWVSASLLGEKKDFVFLRQIKGDVVFDIENRVLQWENVTGASGVWNFTTAGTFNSKRHWQGSWVWEKPLQKMSWKYETFEGRERWIPLDKTMVDWIAANPDFKTAYPFVEVTE